MDERWTFDMDIGLGLLHSQSSLGDLIFGAVFPKAKNNVSREKTTKVSFEDRVKVKIFQEEDIVIALNGKTKQISEEDVVTRPDVCTKQLESKEYVATASKNAQTKQESQAKLQYDPFDPNIDEPESEFDFESQYWEQKEKKLEQFRIYIEQDKEGITSKFRLLELERYQSRKADKEGFWKGIPEKLEVLETKLDDLEGLLKHYFTLKMKLDVLFDEDSLKPSNSTFAFHLKKDIRNGEYQSNMIEFCLNEILLYDIPLIKHYESPFWDTEQQTSMELAINDYEGNGSTFHEGNWGFTLFEILKYPVEMLSCIRRNLCDKYFDMIDSSLLHAMLNFGSPGLSDPRKLLKIVSIKNENVRKMTKLFRPKRKHFTPVQLADIYLTRRSIAMDRLDERLNNFFIKDKAAPKGVTEDLDLDKDHFKSILNLIADDGVANHLVPSINEKYKPGKLLYLLISLGKCDMVELALDQNASVHVNQTGPFQVRSVESAVESSYGESIDPVIWIIKCMASGNDRMLDILYLFIRRNLLSPLSNHSAPAFRACISELDKLIRTDKCKCKCKCKCKVKLVDQKQRNLLRRCFEILTERNTQSNTHGCSEFITKDFMFPLLLQAAVEESSNYIKIQFQLIYSANDNEKLKRGGIKQRSKSDLDRDRPDLLDLLLEALRINDELMKAEMIVRLIDFFLEDNPVQQSLYPLEKRLGVLLYLIAEKSGFIDCRIHVIKTINRICDWTNTRQASRRNYITPMLLLTDHIFNRYRAPILNEKQPLDVRNVSWRSRGMLKRLGLKRFAAEKKVLTWEISMRKGFRKLFRRACKLVSEYGSPFQVDYLFLMIKDDLRIISAKECTYKMLFERSLKKYNLCMLEKLKDMPVQEFSVSPNTVKAALSEETENFEPGMLPMVLGFFDGKVSGSRLLNEEYLSHLKNGIIREILFRKDQTLLDFYCNSERRFTSATIYLCKLEGFKFMDDIFDQHLFDHTTVNFFGFHSIVITYLKYCEKLFTSYHKKQKTMQMAGKLCKLYLQYARALKDDHCTTRLFNVAKYIKLLKRDDKEKITEYQYQLNTAFSKFLLSLKHVQEDMEKLGLTVDVDTEAEKCDLYSQFSVEDFLDKDALGMPDTEIERYDQDSQFFEGDLGMPLCPLIRKVKTRMGESRKDPITNLVALIRRWVYYERERLFHIYGITIEDDAFYYEHEIPAFREDKDMDKTLYSKLELDLAAHVNHGVINFKHSKVDKDSFRIEYR